MTARLAPVLDEATQRRLLHYAREVIIAGAAHRDTPETPPELAENPALREHHGCFVSLHKGRELRGCIGTFEGGAALPETMADMALRASRDDPRFAPVRSDEIAELSLHISILSSREPCPSPDAIEIGRHGVELEVGTARAVFLPRVAPEHGWDTERTLDELCRKARIHAGSWRRQDCRLTVFEALEFGEAD